VETLAERCADILVTEMGIAWVRLSVNKIGAVSAAADVGVIIERGVAS
jgi:dihydroneopterin aldolase